MIREGTLSMANVKHYTKVGNGQCVLKIVNAQAGPKRRLQDIRKKKKKSRSSYGGSVLTNPPSIHEDNGSIPDLASWVKDLALCELWYRLQMGLRCGIAVAVAQVSSRS